MQPTISLRDAIVATIVLSPAFITGLALPWNFHNALAARSAVLSGGIVDSFAHEVRANGKSGAEGGSQGDSDESEESDAPTVTGMPMGGASGFPQPTGGFSAGGFGGGGGGSGCGSAAFPSGTGSPIGQGEAMKKGRAKRADTPAFPSVSMATSAPTGCGGGFGPGPTGQAGPMGGSARS